MKTQGIPNLWDAGKAVFRGKFITLIAFIRKEKRSKISNLSCYHRKLEKEEQIKYQVRRRKEIIKIRAEICKAGNQ